MSEDFSRFHPKMQQHLHPVFTQHPLPNLGQKRENSINQTETIPESHDSTSDE